MKKLLLISLLLIANLFAVGPYRYSDSSESWFYSTRTEGITISKNGYVGIDTTTPSYELDVAGTCQATKFVGSGAEITDITVTEVIVSEDIIVINIDASGIITANKFTDSTAIITGGDISGTTVDVTYAEIDDLYATNLESDMDGTGYDIIIEDINAGGTVTADTKLYSALIEGVNAKFTNLEQDLDGTSFDLIIADINASGTITANKFTDGIAIITDGDISGTTVDVTVAEVDDLYATNLEADMDGTGFTITTNTLDTTDLKATNLERDLDGTGQDLIIADINASGTVTANKFVGNIESNYVQMNDLSGSTYTSLEDWINNSQSAGKISGFELTDNDDGTIDITEGTGILKTSNSDIGETIMFDLAASTNVVLTDESINYILVDYNSGTPIYEVDTDIANVDFNTEFVIGYCYLKNSVSADILEAGNKIPNYNNNNCARLFYRGIERMTGASIGEKATLYLTSTEGVFYLGNCIVTTNSQDTETDGIESYYYYDGSDWQVSSDRTIIDNTYYNDITSGLSELTANRYGVHWIYVCLEEDINVVFGQGNYTLTQANNAEPPASIPDYLSKYAILAAKVIVKKSATSFISIQSAYTTKFTPGSANNHNDLSGLQGGTTDQYYHLTSTEDGYYTGATAQSVLTTASPAFVGVSLSGTITANKLTDGTAIIEDGDISGTTVDATVVEVDDLYATNLEADLDGTDYDLIIADLTVINLESDMDGTGYDITIEDINSGGTVTADTKLYSALVECTNLKATNLELSLDGTGFDITADTFIGALTGTATTANNADTLDLHDTSYFTNASNIASGTLDKAYIDSEVVTQTYSSAVTLSSVDNVFYGDGSNLTGGGSGTVTDNYYNAVTLNSVDNVFYGDGSNLTGGGAGTVTDNYSTAVTLSNVANVFYGDGSNLTNLTDTGMKFGQVNGYSAQAYSADRHHATRVLCPSICTITKLIFQVGNTNAFNIKWALYADNAGQPGALLAQTTAMNVGATDDYFQKGATFTSAYTCAADTIYWIAWCADSAPNLKYDTNLGTSPGGKYKDGSNYAGFPVSPWGASTGDYHSEFTMIF